MRIAFAVGAVVCIIVCYYGVTIYRNVSVSHSLIARAKPYQIDRRATIISTTSVLVLGDSTAVGVGAGSPEESVAGLLADKIHAAVVENYAVSGAVVADLPAQIKQAKLSQYSLILIQIGGNDLTRFHDAKKTAAALDQALAVLPKSHRVAVMPPGNIGSAPILPWFLKASYTRLNLVYHREFSVVVKGRHFIYVNVYKERAADLFSLRPDLYFAADQFHPSSLGYGLWFSDLMDNI